MKAVQLLVNSILPEDLRDYSRTYDSKGISKLMAQVAELHPEQYDKIATGMVNIGRKASWNQGETLRLNDLRPTFDRAPVFAAMDAEVKKARRTSKTDAEFERARNDIWQRYSDQIEKATSGSALAAGNNLSFAVNSGARGKAPQLKAMLSTPGTYTDYAGTTLPLFVRNSFSEGLRPMEYLAGTFGARSAVLCLAKGTMVRMADGTKKSIETVEVGDLVVGADKKGGFKSTKVLSVFKQGLQPVKRWTFNSDNGTGMVTIECTANHKVLNVVSDIVPIHETNGIKLQVGRAWWTRQADDLGEMECYDLEVAHPDHLFVLANGMVVSNSTKRATAKGGFLAKQLSAVSAEQVVTTKDCGTTNGIDLDPSDESLRGRVLAVETDGIAAGTPIEKSVLVKLQKHKGKIMVRSALTCTAEHGVCAQCFGKRMDNKFPHIGDHVGNMASNAVSEPVTQNALNCLAEGTLVRMSDFSTKNIEDVKAGDVVLGADVTGAAFPVKVTATWDQGAQPVQRYAYAMGQTKQRLEVTCTSAHVMLQNKKVSSAWHKTQPGATSYGSPNNMQAVKLPAGFKHKDIAAVLPRSCDVPGLATEPLAWLLGVLLGDGTRWADPSHRVTFSCADNKLIEDMRAALAPFNLKPAPCARSWDWRLSQLEQVESQRDAKTGTFLTEGFRNPAKHLLVKWGISGKYAHEKTVPEAVWAWDNASVAALIAGFIATDGGVYMNEDGHVGVSFSSCSKPMLEAFKSLLAVRLCVYSSALTCTGLAGAGNRKHDQWQFTVTRYDQVKRLTNALPKIPGVKGEKLFSYVGNAAYAIRSPEPFYRAKRKTITELGIARCYDISVDHPDELFVLANGLIVKNSKHTAGMGTGKRVYSGFDTINSLVQSPEIFPDRAEVSQVDGRVERIEPAPQGGFNITVAGQVHYAPHGYDVLVKPGQEVEAGDQLSDGVVDVRDVIQHKGLGEGRRYYAERLKQALDDSGMAANQRNTEVIARAAVNHVVIDDAEGDGEFMPDDIAPYDKMAARYVPADSTRMSAPDSSVKGHFLQAPVLHYSIGTRLTPSKIKRISDAGIKQIHTAETGPTWQPQMTRLATASHNNPDWIARMGASHVGTNLEDSAARGLDSDVAKNHNFIPRLAYGENFGKTVRQDGMF